MTTFKPGDHVRHVSLDLYGTVMKRDRFCSSDATPVLYDGDTTIWYTPTFWLIRLMDEEEEAFAR